MAEKWYIIVNPASGKGLGRKVWNGELSEKLEQAQIPYKQRFTEYSTHAIELSQKAIEEGYRNILAVGGDGTFHEVINGILKQKAVPSTDITFSGIALGTGNDWIKTMELSAVIDDAIEVIKQNKAFLHDVGLATYYNGLEQSSRYFANVGGSGFDAFVAKEMGINKKYGKLSYLIALFSGIFKYKNVPITVKADSRLLRGRIFLVTVAICKYFGSGMKIAPDAIPNDGLFDITLIKDISKFAVFREAKNLFDGTFVKHPEVETFRTSEVMIQSKEDIFLQLDGELLGHGPFRFEMVPQSLKVLIDKYV